MERSVYIPFGPLEKKVLTDTYTYRGVRENHCVASVSRNICKHLVKKAEKENVQYLTICIPAYNEEFEEMVKTLITLMENVQFMLKKVSKFSSRSADSNSCKFIGCEGSRISVENRSSRRIFQRYSSDCSHL
jgi:hypothetical protein